MKKTWNIMLVMWRPVLIGVIGVALIAGLMGYRLSSLTPALSETEIATYNSADNLSEIINNSVNAPYKAAVFIVTSVLDNALGLRLVGAVLGSLSIVIFYLLSRKLLNQTNALITTVLYATTSVLLHTARLASPNIMLLALLALVAVGALIRYDKNKALGWLLASGVISLSLYTPGMIVFILLGAAWQFRSVRRSFEDLTPLIIALCAVIFSLIAAPLVISLIRDPSLYRQYLGLPEVLPSIQTIANNAGNAISSLFAISPKYPVHWLGRQPVLGVFATVLFVYGIINIAKNYRLDRLWALSGIFLLSVVWIAVSGNHQAIIMLIPFVYLVIGLGMQDLMDKWLKVFPYNPIARWTGRIIMLVAISLAVNFHLQRYFVAWPHADETKAAFSQKLPT